MSRLQPVRGTHDLFGDEARRFGHVVQHFQDVARRFGFQPVDVPVFEFTEVFARNIGEATDIVAKEMYSFEDRGGESLTLRPEFTAGLVRAFISNGWQQHAPLRLHAHGPAFRYERPQKGRFRQFHQLDAEIIGAAEPQADLELIAMAHLLLRELGLGERIVLHLNTLGDGESRAAYRAALVDYFSRHKASLSHDSAERLERNPLRILDSKDAGDRALIADAPLIDAYLTPEAAAIFAAVTSGLDALSIPYVRDHRLVRGLDYYVHTAFEFITTHLGAQGTVLGGGRYDGLIEKMGGNPTPGVGWAAGIERLAMLIDAPAAAPGPLAMIPMGPAAEQAGIAIAQRLRAAGFAVEQGFRGNMKKRMARASEAGAPAALILGDSELAAGTIAIKDLASGVQSVVPLGALDSALAPYRSR